MKRLLPFAPLLLLVALLLSPAEALARARQGLDIWWSRVLPALLPSFICVRLSRELGVFQASCRRPRGRLFAFMVFSLVAGAPNGAKLLCALREDGSLSAREAQRLLPLVNSVSPAFLLSIIASGLLKNKALFLPMAVSFYGCLLLLLLPMLLKRTPAGDIAPKAAAAPFPEALSAAIEGGMLDMLRIGGCILFVCTLLALTRPLFPAPAASAALAGCMEVSLGASAIAELPLPLRLKMSLLVGAAAFGGLSLLLQSMGCYPEMNPLPYLVEKLLLGALVSTACYLLFPLFPSLSTAFAPRSAVLSRGLALSALLLSSLLSAAFMAVLSLMVGGRHPR